LPLARSGTPWAPTEGDVGDVLVFVVRAPLLHRRLPFFHRLRGLLDARVDRGKEKEVHEVRVELGAASVDERLSRHGCRLPVVVRSAVRDGVERVGDRDDASGDRNAPSLEPARVACSIPPLVMGHHAVGEVRIEHAQRLEHASAQVGMSGDGATLGGAQGIVFLDDVEERFVDLSDVMEECDAFDALAFVRGEVGCIGKDEGVRGDTPDVGTGIGVIRIDRVEQRLEGGGGKTLGDPAGLFAADEERE